MAKNPRKRSGIVGPKEFWLLIKDAAVAWNNDNAASMGAAIAYYGIFSIAPLLIISIAVAGFFFGEEAAAGQIYAQAKDLLGAEGAVALQGLIESASQPGEGAVATTIGIAAILLGATGAFAELQGAMDRIWQVPEKKAKTAGGVWVIIKRRLFTFGLVLGVAFLLLISLVVSAGISAVQALWAPFFEGYEFVLHFANFIVSFFIVSLLFGLIYKLLPSVSVDWEDVVIGAAVTAVLFNIGKFLIGFYIGSSGVASSFGAAGALIAMLIWVYYSAQIFLLGAEFTWAYAKRYGSRAKK